MERRVKKLIVNWKRGMLFEKENNGITSVFNEFSGLCRKNTDLTHKTFHAIDATDKTTGQKYLLSL